MKLGFFSVIRLFKKMIKMPISENNSEKIEALKSGVRRMKRETQKSIILHLNNYKENIKFKYLIKLVDAVSDVLTQELLYGFSSCADDLLRLNKRVNSKKGDKKRTREILDDIAKNIPKINDKITRVKKEYNYSRSQAEAV